MHLVFGIAFHGIGETRLNTEGTVFAEFVDGKKTHL